MFHHVSSHVALTLAQLHVVDAAMGIGEGEFLHPEAISDTLKCPDAWMEEVKPGTLGVNSSRVESLP